MPRDLVRPSSGYELTPTNDEEKGYISTYPLTLLFKTDFCFSDFYSCVPLR